MRSNRLAALVRLGLVATLVLSMQVPAASATGGRPTSAPIRVADEPGAPSALTTPTLTLAASGASAAAQSQITGLLTDEAGQGIPDAEILLESGTDGVSWEPTGTVTTDLTGAFTASRAIPRTMRFRASWAGRDGEFSAVSATATAVFTPVLSWVPSYSINVMSGRKFVVQVASGVPAHADTACAGVMLFTRTVDGVVKDSKSVPCRGAVDPLDGTAKYTVSTSLSHPGKWLASFRLGADSAHAAADTTGSFITVGACTLKMSLSKSTVAVGGRLTASGRIRDVATGLGAKGLRIRLQRYEGHWKTVASAKSGTAGKVAISTHPTHGGRYRLSFAGSSTRIANSSGDEDVSTVYTFTFTKSGHYTSKKFWMPNNSVRAELSGAGAWTLWLHSQDDKYSAKLSLMDMQVNERIDSPKAGWYHFKVKYPLAGRAWTIKIWT